MVMLKKGVEMKMLEEDEKEKDSEIRSTRMEEE